MSTTIHPTAIVDPGAQIGENVSVGPYSIIEKNSRIGDGCRLISHVQIGENTIIGKNCTMYQGAVLGSIAQDLKYRGEEAWVEIGDNNIFREYTTVNRGTIANTKTIIGNNCAFLSYSHVGHDCIVGDGMIASNSVHLAGHVIIGNDVGFGGIVAVHQFCRIGDHAYIGAFSKVVKNVVPYAMLGGETNDHRIVGINKVGLERRGFDEVRRRQIKRAYKTLFREGLTVQDALEKLEQTYTDDADVMQIVSFVTQSERGIYNMNQ